MDDMIVVSSSDSFKEKYVGELKKFIELKELGNAKRVLGMELKQRDEKIFFSQKGYIRDLLYLYGMTDCNEIKAPMDTNQKFKENQVGQICDERVYQELLGRLMYLSVARRPDITYALSCSSQFSQSPKMIHLGALKRILRYLKGTINYRIQYGRVSLMKGIRCGTDASWDSTKDAKSFSGLLLYRNSDLIHWRNKKQGSVALSTIESELDSMLDGTKELI